MISTHHQKKNKQTNPKHISILSHDSGRDKTYTGCPLMENSNGFTPQIHKINDFQKLEKQLWWKNRSYWEIEVAREKKKNHDSCIIFK